MPESSAVTTITRAISIRQPYAEQILQGKKKVEWRGTNSRLRERIYIYASKGGVDEPAEWRRVGARPGSLPTGVIVGSVEIVGSEFDDDEYQYKWELARPERLPEPLVPLNHPQPVIWRPQFAKRPAQRDPAQPSRTTQQVRGMRRGLAGELVCYHNPDTMGDEVWEVGASGEFSALSSRHYNGAEGTRAWFITGRGSPRRYYLAGWFLVDQIEEEVLMPGIHEYYYIGEKGEVGCLLKQLVEIGKAPWFRDLRRACANFATMQHVRDRGLLRSLETTWAARKASS